MKRLPAISHAELTQAQERAALREMEQDVLPRPDFSKGRTSREWAAMWGMSQQIASYKCQQFVASGHMLADKDWRAYAQSGMRRVQVYRRKGKRE